MCIRDRVKNLKMRVESIASRLEFNERRARALEEAVVYKTVEAEEAPAPRPVQPPQPRPQPPRQQPPQQRYTPPQPPYSAPAPMASPAQTAGAAATPAPQ